MGWLEALQGPFQIHLADVEIKMVSALEHCHKITSVQGHLVQNPRVALKAYQALEAKCKIHI